MDHGRGKGACLIRNFSWQVNIFTLKYVDLGYSSEFFDWTHHKYI